MKKKTFRFAIIGCGHIAQRHVIHIQNNGQLVAVCDIIFSKADSLGTTYNAHPYSDIDQLLASEKNIDVVVICTPNGLHAEHSIKALQAGHHVLCEKPMASTVEQCEAMIKAAEIAKRQLMIIKQNRYNPPVVAVKKLLNENRLGKIFNVQLNCFWNRNNDYYHDTWKGKKDLDGGILFTQFSHFIDLLFWFVGDIDEVKVYKNNFLHQNSIEFEDTGVVILQFQSGAIGTINYTINTYQKNMEGSITLFGEKGTLKIGGEYLNLLEYQQIDGYEIPTLPTGNQSNNYGTYQGSMSNHDKVYQNVIEVLQEKAPFVTTLNESKKVIEIIQKINSSC